MANDTRPARQFEALLRQLQATVTRLEEESLTLEEAVAAYEESVALASACGRMLDEAALRVSQIDARSRELREAASSYTTSSFEAARLLLGDDDDDLADLLDLEE